MSIEVVGLGALNIDYIYQVERILEDGEAVVKESLLSPGGSAANTTYGLAKLGVKAGFAGATGDDDDGQLLIQDFQKVGIDTSQIKIKQGTRTGSVVCLSDSLGKRSLYVIPGANSLLTSDDIDLVYSNQAKILHISSFADERQFKVLLGLIESLDSSVKVSFTPGAIYAAKGLKALTPVLNRTEVLFVNHDEIRQLTGQNVMTGAEACIKQGCQIVVVTLGKGRDILTLQESQSSTVNTVSYIRDAHDEYLIEPPEEQLLPVVDTTGAGDAFATGFLYGLLHGKELKQCGFLGNIVAQFSISKTGAREGLPTLNELSQRYRQLYNKDL